MGPRPSILPAPRKKTSSVTLLVALEPDQPAFPITIPRELATANWTRSTTGLSESTEVPVAPSRVESNKLGGSSNQKRARSPSAPPAVSRPRVRRPPSPSARPNKRSRPQNDSNSDSEVLKSTRPPTFTGRNRKKRERKGGRTNPAADLEPPHHATSVGDSHDANETLAAQDADTNDEHSLSALSQAMSQLPQTMEARSLMPQTDDEEDHSPEPNETPAALDIVLSGMSLEGETAESLNARWSEMSSDPKGLLQALVDRPPLEESELSWRNAAYIGTARLNWLSEHTWAVRGLVNNRPLSASSVQLLYQSLLDNGMLGEDHPIIVIVKRSELEAVAFSRAQLPWLTFSGKTLVGIVAGAHRLEALRRFCMEAQRVLRTAERYLAKVDTELTRGKMTSAKAKALQDRKEELQETIDRLQLELKHVSHWHAEIYDWDYVLAPTASGANLRQLLSQNTTLAHKDASAAERIAQVWRHEQKAGRDHPQLLKPGAERSLWRSVHVWRPFLGRLAQFPALASEINGNISRYAALSSDCHWPGAAIFALSESLSALEELFEPVPMGLAEHELGFEFWKTFATAALMKDLDDALNRHGGKLLETGERREWSHGHRSSYWNAVEQVFKTHFPIVPGEKGKTEQYVFRNAIAREIPSRISGIKSRLVLPLYSQGLKERLFSWFQLNAAAFYAIADICDHSWMAFSYRANMFRYDDAGSHIIRCLRGRADKKHRDSVTRYIIRHLFDSAWLAISSWLVNIDASDAINGTMRGRVANEGVRDPSDDEVWASQVAFATLKRFSGPRSPGNAEDKPSEIWQEMLHQHAGGSPAKEKLLIDVGSWWTDWVNLGAVDPRTAWPKPLTNDQIERVEKAYHRTRNSSRVYIWEEMVQSEAFQSIAWIFQNVPHHRSRAEEKFWHWWRPSASDIKSLRCRDFELDQEGVDRLRSICLLGFNPKERKVAGRRGGHPSKVITSVDKLPANSVPPPILDHPPTPPAILDFPAFPASPAAPRVPSTAQDPAVASEDEIAIDVPNHLPPEEVVIELSGGGDLVSHNGIKADRYEFQTNPPQFLTKVVDASISSRLPRVAKNLPADAEPPVVLVPNSSPAPAPMPSPKPIDITHLNSDHSDPFSIGVSVPRSMMFQTYISRYWFDASMWPKYSDWPRLKDAIDAWMRHDRAALTEIWPTVKNLNSGSYSYIWYQIRCGYVNLMFWCSTRLQGLNPSEMRKSPLPVVDELGWYPALYAAAADWDKEFDYLDLQPPHVINSEALHFIRDINGTGLKLLKVDHSAMIKIGEAFRIIEGVDDHYFAPNDKACLIMCLYALHSCAKPPEPTLIEELLDVAADPDLVPQDLGYLAAFKAAHYAFFRASSASTRALDAPDSDGDGRASKVATAAGSNPPRRTKHRLKARSEEDGSSEESEGIKEATVDALEDVVIDIQEMELGAFHPPRASIRPAGGFPDFITDFLPVVG
ncbi:hypothetical protein FRB90_003996, partial [Tulasnella sp. 427]